MGGCISILRSKWNGSQGKLVYNASDCQGEDVPMGSGHSQCSESMIGCGAHHSEVTNAKDDGLALELCNESQSDWRSKYALKQWAPMGNDNWNSWYSKETQPYDWLQNYAKIKDILMKLTNNDFECRILNVGCGSSTLPEEMYDDGFHKIVNIDISVVVVEQMLVRNRSQRPGLQWLVGDATRMDFGNACFDLVIDKSLLDTFTCGGYTQEVCTAYLKEVDRVLSDNGNFLCISYGTPHTRLIFFDFQGWKFDVNTIELPGDYGLTTHYAYICRRKGQKV